METETLPGPPSTLVHHRYATVDGGVRLHYVEAGDGPPVVLLHGLTCSAGDDSCG
jgi:pimeloyl-ACP methyl ester carboxylesterase